MIFFRIFGLQSTVDIYTYLSYNSLRFRADPAT